MTAFDSTKTALSQLLSDVVAGKLQLPDFQRGWVWDDAHIRSLLVSIARSFPIGTVMMLETGGEARFQVRPIEGVASPAGGASVAERLLLDGQQRLTSLTQVLKLDQPVVTRDKRGKTLKVYYYIDIERALEVGADLEDAIFTVDEHKQLRTNFGRDVALELKTTADEIHAGCFPCNQILNSDRWENLLAQIAPTKIFKYFEFRSKFVEPFRRYDLPVINLKKETSKEAVCLVFEKVNTGGVPLSVFELVTASWAADGFNLRDDLSAPGKKGRLDRLRGLRLLRSLEATDFLQGVSLLHSYDKRLQDLKAGRSPKEATGVTAKREHILRMPLDAFQRWADKLTQGFIEADKFLRAEGFHHPDYLPYRTQLIPMAAIMAHLGERWHEPKPRAQLQQWFWCGVLGELYGSAAETRAAQDVQEVLAWLKDPASTPPSTVEQANFNPQRLDTLRTRTSAAYRGIYILLQRPPSAHSAGARDLFWRDRVVDLDRDEVQIDIHHIFPKAWCASKHIAPRIYNAIVNKTPISYKANRMIGGKAPSLYLAQLQAHGIDDATMDDILTTHLIDPALLRQDSFNAFYTARKAALLALIVETMGKASSQDAEFIEAEDGDDGEE